MTQDPRDLHRTREGVLAGLPARDSRPVIAASWRRMKVRGLDPGSPPEVAPLPDAELEARRARSRLAPLLSRLKAALGPAVEAGGLLMVVADEDGRVLWRHGPSGVRRLADRLGFVGGSAWTEGNVGTNAIGTSLVLGGPVQIHGAEHYVDSHTRWGCAAAPLHDPWTGRTIGVVDVSGPASSMHPSALSLVDLAARLASLEVRNEHVAGLERLRAHAAPLLARVGGRAVVVDQQGHVAAVTGMSAPGVVPLPADLTVGEVWLPTLGSAVAEALPGGWLLRLGPSAERAGTTGAADALAEDAATALVLDLAVPGPTLRVSGPSGSWTQVLSPRHAEIMVALLVHREGRSAAELGEDLFADASKVVTVRAEMSRLRRILGPVLCRQPYRVAPEVAVELRLPADTSLILPGSSAPVITGLTS